MRQHESRLIPIAVSRHLLHNPTPALAGILLAGRISTNLTVQLYLLRHADADTVAVNDDDRYLSEKGQHQCLRVAKFCNQREILPEIILSSPLKRAKQTAKHMADILKLKMEVANWLAAGVIPETMIAQLKPYEDKRSVMIVGHEPDFSQFCSYLLGIPAELIRIRKASLVSLEVIALKPSGARLDFLIPAKLTYPMQNGV